jgi:hypothetical protein
MGKQKRGYYASRAFAELDRYLCDHHLSSDPAYTLYPNKYRAQVLAGARRRHSTRKRFLKERAERGEGQDRKSPWRLKRDRRLNPKYSYTSASTAMVRMAYLLCVKPTPARIKEMETLPREIGRLIKDGKIKSGRTHREEVDYQFGRARDRWRVSKMNRRLKGSFPTKEIVRRLPHVDRVGSTVIKGANMIQGRFPPAKTYEEKQRGEHNRTERDGQSG